MDCAVVPLKRHNYSIIQTVDFFYPLVDNPKVMGKIALANVLSDIFAIGVTAVDSLTMIISAPTEFTEKERDCILPMICEGFLESSDLAGCKVNIKNITINPWCMIGGIATSICTPNEIIRPTNAKAGDVIVLTKPLGTQLATNAYIWMTENHEKYQQLINKNVSNEDIEESYHISIKSMTYLNKIAAILMHKYEAHAATDITGFGLLGHAKNLALFQSDDLKFEINTLPIIKHILKFANILGHDKKLTQGMAPETSGGLLICFSPINASRFCEEFHNRTKFKQNAWIVGKVLPTETRNACINENPQYISIDF